MTDEPGAPGVVIAVVELLARGSYCAICELPVTPKVLVEEAAGTTSYNGLLVNGGYWPAAAGYWADEEVTGEYWRGAGFCNEARYD